VRGEGGLKAENQTVKGRALLFFESKKMTGGKRGAAPTVFSEREGRARPKKEREGTGGF